MKRDEVENLWDRHLSGDSLSPDEERRLLEALTSDASLRENFLGEERIDGALSAFARSRTDAREFARSFDHRLSLEDEATGFVREVESRLEKQETTSGRPRRPARRRSNRRNGDRTPRYWLAALAAAGILFGIIVILSVTTPGSDGTIRKERLEPAADRGPGEAPPAPVREERRPEPAPDPERKVTRKSPAPEGPPAPSAERPGERRQGIEKGMPRRVAKNERAPAPPEKAVDPAPNPEPKSPQRTEAAVATLSEVTGEVFVVKGSERTPAQRGKVLRSGEGLITVGAESGSALEFQDGTSVELEGASEIHGLKADKGKRLIVVRGTVLAEVAKQPRDEPMVFETPHGTATVLGTTLRILVDPDPKTGTRLEVQEGRVRLKRGRDGKSVLVAAGHYAVAASGVAMRSLPLKVTLFADKFERAPLQAWPPGWRRTWDSPNTRSGFRVAADASRPGNRLLTCVGAPASTSQHAVIPLDAYTGETEFAFRMRLTGDRITRAGIQFEEGKVMPSVEYDARAQIVRVDWPRGEAVQQVPLRLPPGRWSAWRVQVADGRMRLSVDGRAMLSATVPGFEKIEIASLVSRGADPAQFDDVEVRGEKR